MGWRILFKLLTHLSGCEFSPNIKRVLVWRNSSAKDCGIKYFPCKFVKVNTSLAGPLIPRLPDYEYSYTPFAGSHTQRVINLSWIKYLRWWGRGTYVELRKNKHLSFGTTCNTVWTCAVGMLWFPRPTIGLGNALK